MTKELYILAHEELISKAMDKDPSLNWDKAYDQTADKAYDKMKDMLADKADNARIE